MGIKDLDKALSHLYTKHKYFESRETLQESCFGNNQDIDVEAVIIHLKKDGLLHFGINEISPDQFKLSIAGRIKHETGGYVGERKRLSNRASLQSLQTWVILVASVLAAIGTIGYFVLELNRYCR